MERMKNIVVLIGVLCLMLLLTTTCKKEAAETTDTVSSASNLNDYAQLPEPSYTYEVIGHVEGIQKYVVKINDDIFRGGQILSEKGAAVLKEHNIKTIISVTPDDDERSYAEKFGFTLIELPFTHDFVPKGQLEKFIKAVQGEEKPIYIHCHGGSHRAGALIAAYRIHIEGWSEEDTKKEFEKLGGNLVKAEQILKSIL